MEPVADQLRRAVGTVRDAPAPTVPPAARIRQRGRRQQQRRAATVTAVVLVVVMVGIVGIGNRRSTGTEVGTASPPSTVAPPVPGTIAAPAGLRLTAPGSATDPMQVDGGAAVRLVIAAGSEPEVLQFSVGYFTATKLLVDDGHTVTVVEYPTTNAVSGTAVFDFTWIAPAVTGAQGTTFTLSALTVSRDGTEALIPGTVHVDVNPTAPATSNTVAR